MFFIARDPGNGEIDQQAVAHVVLGAEGGASRQREAQEQRSVGVFVCVCVSFNNVPSRWYARPPSSVHITLHLSLAPTAVVHTRGNMTFRTLHKVPHPLDPFFLSTTPRQNRMPQQSNNTFSDSSRCQCANAAVSAPALFLLQSNRALKISPGAVVSCANLWVPGYLVAPFAADASLLDRIEHGSFG